MARPNRSADRRAELLPTVAAAFAELGYHRTTTAQLAARCGVLEPALYRLWPDKRAMFTAAIGFVADHAQRVWNAEAERPRHASSAAEAVLTHEADHLGEFRLYRILFAGLSETDDPVIRAALQEAYRTFHAAILLRVTEHRRGRQKPNDAAADLVAWALIGLGTAITVGRELDLLSADARRDLLATVGRHLLDAGRGEHCGD